MEDFYSYLVLHSHSVELHVLPQLQMPHTVTVLDRNHMVQILSCYFMTATTIGYQSVLHTSWELNATNTGTKFSQPGSL